MMYKGNLSVIPGGRKCPSMLPKLTTAGNAVFKLEGATEYKLYTLCVNNSVFRSCLQLDCYLVLKKWATLWLSLFSFDSFHVVMCVYSMWRVACKSFRVECFIIKLLWRHHLINWFLHDLPCCVIRFFFVIFLLKTHKIIIFVSETLTIVCLLFQNDFLILFAVSTIYKISSAILPATSSIWPQHCTITVIGSPRLQSEITKLSSEC